MTLSPRFIALAVLVLAGAGRCVAGPITEIDGEYNQVAGGTPQFNVLAFTLVNGTGSFVPTGPSGFDASDLNINVSEFTTTVPRIDFGTTVLTISNPSFPSSRAVFNITTPGRVVSNDPDYDGFNPTAEFETNVSLVSNNIPGLDLGGFSTGLLRIFLEPGPGGGGVEITPGGGTDENGDFDPYIGIGDAGGRADLIGSIRARFVIVGTAPVPEPATIALFGFVAFGGAGALVRRWRKK